MRLFRASFISLLRIALAGLSDPAAANSLSRAGSCFWKVPDRPGERGCRAEPARRVNNRA